MGARAGGEVGERGGERIERLRAEALAIGLKSLLPPIESAIAGR